MKLNFISVSQLMEKGYPIIMDDSLKLYDAKRKLVLKLVMTKNITFMTLISVVEVDSFATMIQTQWEHHITHEVWPLVKMVC